MFDIEYNIEKVNHYLGFRNKLMKEVENKSYSEKNRIWVENYKQIEEKNLENLPQLLSLIHPDFYRNKEGNNIANILNPKHKRSGIFSQGIETYNNCQIDKLIGTKCFFNKEPRERGKCEADHAWPYSLGGANSLTNRVLLCSHHNHEKGSGIYFFDWKKYPEWLDKRLKQMYNLKS